MRKTKKKTETVIPEDVLFYYLRVSVTLPDPDYDAHGKLKKGTPSRPGYYPGKKEPEKVIVRPLACVCFGKVGPCSNVFVWTRGIAICSDIENFVKADARQKAYGRFRRAKKRRGNSDPIIVERDNGSPTPMSVTQYIMMATTSPDWPGSGADGRVYKSGYDVQLTDKEKKIAEIAEAKRQKRLEAEAVT